MSRMIFGFALIAALGCGPKPAPTAAPDPEPRKEPEPPAPPKGETPKAEPAKVVWELDPAKHAIPDAPVRGRIAGAEATPDVAVAGDELAFRVTKPGAAMAERSVSIRFAPGASPLGRSWKVKPDDAPGPAVPAVWLEVQGQPIQLHPSGYALTLDLGPRKNGKVAGKVHLSLPDEAHTVLAGTFAADYFRLPTEPPGPDDAPSVAGTVTVAGAAADAQVRVAYAAFLPSGAAQFAESLTATGRYEHLKLDPGHYLVSAAVVGGPAVWRWIDVPAGANLTENFALDATKTGGLEVSAPPDAKGKVLVAPAADPARPPIDANLFATLAAQVVRADIEMVAGKALVKNLGPGKYEVRLGDERRTVEVVAGKTAEVNLTPMKK